MEASAVRMASQSRLRLFWSSLDHGQRRSLAMMTAVVAALHLIGFGILFLVVAPHHYSLGSGGAFTIGIGVTAYTLGMRHAFDADHIAAIDNTTRKLMADGKRPMSVGFWFSLGHSSIVFGLALLLSIGIRSLAGPVRTDGSSLHDVTRLDRDARLRHLSVRDRRAQRGDPGRDPQGLPQDEARHLRRGARSRSS